MTTVNEFGHLSICGKDVVALAQKYQTPLYIMDKTKILASIRSFKNSMDKYYNGKGLITYASKAFLCQEMARIVMDEGIGIDVVSEGELYTAISVGFPAQKIFFHGNNKTVGEISYALSYGVGRIVVDNLDELELISNISKTMNKTADILLRLKPGVDAHTHSFIRTGQIDSKFGLAIQTNEAMEAVKIAIETPNINLKGFHCHIGSQIFDITPFEHAAEVMLEFIADVKQNFGYEIDELDLGGGFGIKYAEEDDPQPYENYMERVSKIVFDTCTKLNIKTPFIVLEPGRSIVGEAGTTIYTVGAIKDIKNVRKYVSVDGGMCDNPRYALYEARYEAVVANRANLAKNQLVTIVGKCCESGDLIGKDMPLGDVNVGDLLAVFSTGAYNYSMSSNYNRILKPAVLLVDDETEKIIVKRETLDDIIRNDI